MDANALALRIRDEAAKSPVTQRSLQMSGTLLDPPVQRDYQEADGSKLAVWVAFEENDGGYHVIFDPSTEQFGLASNGVVLGLYGNFTDTIKAL